MLIPPAPGHPLTQGFSGTNLNEPKGWLFPTKVGSSVGLVYPRGKRSAFVSGIEEEHIHLALDYGCPIGTKLVAPQSGYIAAQGTIAHFADGSIDGEMYTIVRVRKTSTLQTLYLLTHLSKFLHPVGYKVTQGEVIALSGETGKITGPHTHFELAVIPADLSVMYFWNRLYNRYNPFTFYAGGVYASDSLIIPN